MALAQWLLTLTEGQREDIDAELSDYIGWEVGDALGAIWRVTDQEIDRSMAELLYMVKKSGNESALWRIQE